jgi:hypothetical protein
MSTAVYPPFELQGDGDAFTAIIDGPTGYWIDALGGRIGGVWLRDRKGESWLVAADQRDLCFKFEVFALGVMSIKQLRARWRDWKLPTIPADMPEPFRSIMAMRPPEPVAPVSYDDWPFETDRVEVLRRAEFIVEDVDVGPTFGNSPNAQSAVAPGSVPKEANASCEVAVGLLFSGRDGRRFLLATDWMPMDLIVTQEASQIDEFVADCERIDLRLYMAALSSS